MISQEWRGRAALVLASGIWGSLYVVSKVVLEVVPPMSLVWMRYLLAVLALFILGKLQGIPFKVGRKEWPLVGGVGFIGYFISIWAQFAGTQASSAHMGAIITSTTPIFVILLARWLLREALTFFKMLAVGLATAGVLIIVGLPGESYSTNMIKGEALLILAAVTWAWMSVMVKQIPKSYSTLSITFWAAVIGLICSTPFFVFDWGSVAWFHQTDALIWSGVFYIGLIATAGAFYLWNLGLTMTKAGSDSVYLFFQPVVGSLLGWALLGEKLTHSFWVGGFLILTGVVLTSYGKNEKLLLNENDRFNTLLK